MLKIRKMLIAVRFAPCRQRACCGWWRAGSGSGVSGAIFCKATRGHAIQHYANWDGNRNENLGSCRFGAQRGAGSQICTPGAADYRFGELPELDAVPGVELKVAFLC